MSFSSVKINKISWKYIQFCLISKSDTIINLSNRKKEIKLNINYSVSDIDSVLKIE